MRICPRCMEYYNEEAEPFIYICPCCEMELSCDERNEWKSIF